MTIELPTDPAPSGCSMTYVDFGGFNEPALGAEVQRIDRMGNRFRASFSYAPLPSKDLGRVFVGRLIRAKSEGVRLPLPLLGFDPGAPGTIMVDGAGQAGRGLAVRGGTPNYAVREGQWFSVQRGDGRHYLHLADAQSILDGGGAAVVPLSPMLRYEFADGAHCHFGQPVIEGRVIGQDWAWQMQLDHNIPITFDVEEWG